MPTIVLDAANDGLGPPDPLAVHQSHFTRLVDHRVLPVGHNLPQEAPAAVVDAVVTLLGQDSSNR